MKSRYMIGGTMVAIGLFISTGADAKVLFSDSFDRADSYDIDGSMDGIMDDKGSGLSAGTVYVSPYVDPINPVDAPDSDSTNGGGQDITDGELRLAVGPGTSCCYLDHNFINTDILTNGGFRVSVDVAGYNQSTLGQGGVFSIGLTKAEADSCGDPWNGVPDGISSCDAFGGVDADAVADFWFGIRGDQSLVYGGVGQNNLTVFNGTGSKTGTISATFAVTNFSAGSTVAYELFFEETSVASGSFSWSDDNANYILLDSRDNTAVRFDNFIVETATIDEPDDPPDPSQDTPNIIMVLLDDMGWSDLGCYGGEARTPTIDSLAANGIRFRNFYNTSRCSTTRMSLLSGLYTHQVAVDPAASLPNWKPDNNISIPELLRTEGYHTYMAGKWHLGTIAGRTPWDRGFQHTYGFGDTGAGIGENKWVNDAKVTSENNEVIERTYGTEPYDYYQTDAIVDHALDFVDHHVGKDDGQSFFMYLPFYAPHFDMQAPMSMVTNVPAGEQSYLEIYTQGWDVVRSNRYERMVQMGIIDPLKYPLSPKGDCPYNWDYGEEIKAIPDWDSLSDDRKADLSLRMALYTAMIDKIDQNLARLVEKLETDGLLDDTLILLISDNGGNAEGGMFGKSFGENNHAPLTGSQLANMGQPGAGDGLWLGGGWANVADTPLRYFKRYSHEGGIRTPCIAYWPSGITNPGRWTEQAGHLVDILATAADLSNAEYPSSYFGRTVLPMEGESLDPVFKDEPVFDRELGFEHESCRAFIDGHWKFVTKTLSNTDGTSPEDTYELYNLDVDPVELNNLAEEEPEKLAELIGKWNAWAQHVGVAEGRWLSLDQTVPAATGSDLFLDTFSRSYDEDIDVHTNGMSGSRLAQMGAGGVYYEGFEGSGQATSIEVLNNRLRLANGMGMAENGLMHNFVGQDIIDAGGFSVEMRIHSLNTIADDSPGRYVGFGIGMTQAEAAAGSDIADADSFRGSPDNPGGKCDFFVDLDIDDNIKVWVKGQLLETIPSGGGEGTLTAAFALTGFGAGDAVVASVYFNGEQLDIDSADAGSLTRTFTWENSDANYLGMSARTTGYADVDNFAVRLLPLSRALACGYATRSGLSGNDAALNADPDGDGNANLVEFAIGSDPAVADSGTRGIASVVLTNNVWELDMRRHIDYASIGLEYLAVYCTNLMSNVWYEVPYDEMSSEDVPGNADYETVRIALPETLVEECTNLFIRAAYE